MRWAACMGKELVCGKEWRRRCMGRGMVLALLGTCVWLKLGPALLVEQQQTAASTARLPADTKLATTSTELSISQVPAADEPEIKLPIHVIKRSVQEYNSAQTILNEDIYGPLRNDSVVIVVQVHTRLAYLRELIASLAQARDIESALVIFSHDYYDERINELVQSVHFCKVMQIFYPYSIQTHPNEFPGEDPLDCPRNIDKEQALLLKCKNARFPDLYGHYREARFTQTKHHWWWKLRRVFDQLQVMRSHAGPVLFLEEDHYVAEDFLHVLRLMEATGKVHCARCSVISLGTYLKTFSYYGLQRNRQPPQPQAGGKHGGVASWDYQLLPTFYQKSQRVEVSPWVSSKHNMGMAFNRSVWTEIKRCAPYFCKFDDYNWDWSLQHLSQSCMEHKLHAMVVKGPRVFHIGECGVHHRKKNCGNVSAVEKLAKVLSTVKKNFYPDHLTLTFTTIAKKVKLHKGNGGWGDLRDHQLCMGIVQS